MKIESRNLLKKIIKETLQQLAESQLTTDIINAAFNNVKIRTSGGYDIPVDEFKKEVEAQVKSIESRSPDARSKFSGVSETEKLAIEDLLRRIPDTGRFSQRDVYFAIQQLNADAPNPERAAPIDMKSLPDPSQVNVREILSSLAREKPGIFGDTSESDPQTAYLASLINPSDKQFFSHGTEYGATTNVRGEKYRVFPKDSSGAPVRRQDGSIVHFSVEPRMSVGGVVYDVYTNSFVSRSVFDQRNNEYRRLWAQKKLPSPIKMKDFRNTRFGR